MTHSEEGKKITDQDYLKHEQYRTDANLQARITLHRKYGTNPGSWFRWILDLLPVQADTVALEIGCGPGDLWYENRERLPATISLLLGDLSIGMVKAARNRNCAQSGFRFLAMDAQHIPLPPSSLDIVVANHMLYHVPDMDAALLEIKRVLKPGGLLCAATNGSGHMRQIHELVGLFNPSYSAPLTGIWRFTLENGPERVSRYFSSVETIAFEDNLIVTNAHDLVAYITSMWHIVNQIDEQTLQSMSAYIEQEIRVRGHIFIQKSQGVIIARV